MENNLAIIITAALSGYWYALNNVQKLQCE